MRAPAACILRKRLSHPVKVRCRFSIARQGGAQTRRKKSTSQGGQSFSGTQLSACTGELSSALCRRFSPGSPL